MEELKLFLEDPNGGYAISQEAFMTLSLPEMLCHSPLFCFTHADDTVKVKLKIPRLVCADGFSVSVQASATHYCTPCDNVGPYRSVEVAYPSEALPDLWAPFRDDPSEPLGIHANVPIENVLFLIAAHGGLNIPKMFENHKHGSIE